MTTAQMIPIVGGQIRYEVRGNGPVLVIAGAPMEATMFTGLAAAMATTHTVITHDPRGISGSTLDDPEQDSTPELRADDIAALLDAVGADTADVFGSSGGAVSGLAFAQRYPERLRTLVAHEPPVVRLLPDAGTHLSGTEELIATFHRDGLEAAWAAFMGTAGFDEDADGPPGMMEPTEADLANGARFFAHELRGTANFLPDIDALEAGPFRVVIGVGAESGQLETYATSKALANRLGTEMVTFPGDHGGFIPEPDAFADVLRSAISPPGR